MEPFADTDALARLLPGRWSVKATNLPVWVAGERRDATFEYALRRERPLALAGTFRFVDPDGRHKAVHVRDRWNGHGFTRRTRGAAGWFVRSRWEVAGARQGLVVVRFDKTVGSPEGVDVVVAEGVDATDLRRIIAADPGSFGLSVEEFASLTWLDHLPPLD